MPLFDRIFLICSPCFCPILSSCRGLRRLSPCLSSPQVPSFSGHFAPFSCRCAPFSCRCAPFLCRCAHFPCHSVQVTNSDLRQIAENLLTLRNRIGATFRINKIAESSRVCAVSTVPCLLDTHVNDLGPNMNSHDDDTPAADTQNHTQVQQLPESTT